MICPIPVDIAIAHKVDGNTITLDRKTIFCTAHLTDGVHHRTNGRFAAMKGISNTKVN